MNKHRGTRRENQVKAFYADRDWFVIRAGGSFGPADLVAIQPSSFPGLCRVELVQVKSDVRGPYVHFGPAERQSLLAAGRLTGAQVVLCWWPPRGKPHFIPPDQWPPPRPELNGGRAA